MPGYFGLIKNNYPLPFKFSLNIDNNLMIDKIIYKNLILERYSVKKFINDKVFSDSNDYFLSTEGVLLNSLELTNQFNKQNLTETIICMYNLFGDYFFKYFRGSFSGIFIDKSINKIIVFTNQIGDKVIYYSNTKFGFLFSSDINFITDFYVMNQLNYTLNMNSAYQILTYGYFVETNTAFNEISRLLPGHCIIITSGVYQIHQYHKFDNTPDYSKTEEEIIENIDLLFRRAISKAFNKDIEYGYNHLVSLSGGLDSRMTTFVANDLGFSDKIYNYTFSQTNYLDETIPKAIITDLKHEWIFKSLDNGIFLKDIDSTIRLSGGSALYYGLAHGKSLFDKLNFEKFGLVHTGMLGDVSLGSFYSSPIDNKEFILTDGMYSTLLSSKLNNSTIKNNYNNQEIYNFYIRGFSGTNQGLIVAQQITESYSPFLDVDFLEYCLKIPIKFRYNHKIYFKWMETKYPKSTKYKWEKINAKISSKSLFIFNRKILIKDLPLKFIHLFKKIFKIPILKLNSLNHMNPLDYWYYNNLDLRTFLDNYFSNNIELLSSFNSLKHDTILLYNKGNTTEKLQVLTLLGILRNYFSSNNLR